MEEPHEAAPVEEIIQQAVEEPMPLPPPPAQRRYRWGPSMNQSDASTSGDGGQSAADAEAAEKKRKRRSRWEVEDTAKAIVPVGDGSKAIIGIYPKEVVLSNGWKVSMPSTITGEQTSSDPKLKELHDQLTELNRKLANNELDIPPEGQRSPSPEPVYDRNGIRLNTREIRYRDRLLDNRQKVIEELIKDDPNFKPPSDYKPRKYTRKIFIPINEFPNYNFIGLIIGPRGNTQKRMQRETNTKIAIRGRGSVKEGANRDPKYDYGEDEELHVLITGDTREDADKAADMIQKLLEPVDETHNEHKRLQLRELAALNGTLKDETACYICGESTHRSEACPKQKMELYVLPTEIKAKVDALYERDVARMGHSTAGMESEYQSFLKELGGAPPPELMGEDAAARAGLGARVASLLSDDCKLYVGSLPPAFNDAMLRAMFEPFGTVTHASVMMDSATGTSKCFGFVHFTDAGSAAAAVKGMHGKAIDNKPLVVRLRSDTTRATGGPGLGAPSSLASRSPYAGMPIDECKLYVGFLEKTVGDAQLRALFEAYGPVVECRVITDRVTGESKGYGFLTMGSPEAAQTARKGLDGYRLDGKTISVKIAGTKGEPTAV
eukprot:CAMPEP_0202915954 /NCGR_PEP_ID=MMETSP1392-20130828/67191_1 /ASSEMBLY_ACC=CAM_ASM_000868 /TAXON_ID=225041 /ORGANISM="Chlamydomonas chlamydogama, Strain SAG 11-48b" /LENGTH=607 /DNA_ID=CAMNT_0049608175 /DNA_START=45 /DNA_END=1865 /DNA_ORIENTATION=-